MNGNTRRAYLRSQVYPPTAIFTAVAIALAIGFWNLPVVLLAVIAVSITAGWAFHEWRMLFIMRMKTRGFRRYEEMLHLEKAIRSWPT